MCSVDDRCLEARGLSFSYGSASFIEELDLVLPPGQLTALLGPNGSGKSTLLKLFDGLLEPSCGEVRVGGRPLKNLRAAERAQLVAYLPQEAPCPSMTVRSYVACGRHPYTGMGGKLDPESWQRVDAALERVGLEQLAGRDMAELSGGQRQLARLALVIAQDTPIVLLDEPVTYLDISAAHKLMAIARSLAKHEGKTVVVVIHDIELALRYAQKVALMHKGVLKGVFTAQEAALSGLLERVFSMRVVPIPGEAPGSYAMVPRDDPL